MYIKKAPRRASTFYNDRKLYPYRRKVMNRKENNKFMVNI